MERNIAALSHKVLARSTGSTKARVFHETLK